MPIETTYTNARANFASICNDVASTRDVVLIRRRGDEDVALISATELRSLEETAHLLRSPRNAGRLMKTLMRAKSRKGKPRTSAALRKELGFEKGK